MAPNLSVASQVAWVSEFGAAIDMDRVTGDPACIVGGEEGHHRADVVRLGHAFERLYTERDLAARLGLGEVRHVGLDHPRGDSVDADAAGTQGRREMLHQRV